MPPQHKRSPHCALPGSVVRRPLVYMVSVGLGFAADLATATKPEKRQSPKVGRPTVSAGMPSSWAERAQASGVEGSPQAGWPPKKDWMLRLSMTTQRSIDLTSALFGPCIRTENAPRWSAASCSPTDSLRSTIGARGLNFRVRNGTGCASPAMAADQRGAFSRPGDGDLRRALGAAQRGSRTTPRKGTHHLAP